MNDKIKLAFDAASGGLSPDRVIVDPQLNASFLAECRKLGLAGSDATLNRTLLNMRKRGLLRGLKSRRVKAANDEAYRFAAEAAARFLERRDGISLDDILCDPQLADEFDRLAADIAPGFSSFEYRWAALGLRKKKQLAPELLSRVVQAQHVLTFNVTGLDLATLPPESGLYIFFTSDRVLYVGEAENLANRLRKHLDHSDNKNLARWLWEQDSAPLHLELHVLRTGVETRVRRALETELIRSRNSVFNIKR